MDAGEFERVDDPHRPRDQPDSGKLNQRVQIGAHAAHVVEVAADGPPQHTHENQQDARRPDVDRSKQAFGDEAREPDFDGVAREHAVMQREKAEQQNVECDLPQRPFPAAGIEIQVVGVDERDRSTPGHQVRVGAKRERSDEDRSAQPEENTLEFGDVVSLNHQITR